MKVSKTYETVMEYHRTNSKKNTVNAYYSTLSKFKRKFGDYELTEVTTDDALSFLNALTKDRKQGTKRTRYAHLNAFFNFVRKHMDPESPNPCNTFMMKKLFRKRVKYQWDVIGKDAMDEIIFRTTNTRDRLVLELMARCGMRVGEVLKLIADDFKGQKLTIRDPKSGLETETIFIPSKIADRLNEYIRTEGIQPDKRIFSMCYETARKLVKRSGELVKAKLTPHDLRRFAATFASRSGVPIEIISKVILRHANLSTTQMYLGKVDDKEALRWIEKLYT